MDPVEALGTHKPTCDEVLRLLQAKMGSHALLSAVLQQWQFEGRDADLKAFTDVLHQTKQAVSLMARDVLVVEVCHGVMV